MNKINQKIKNKNLLPIFLIIVIIMTFGLSFNNLLLNNDSIRRISGNEMTRLSTGRFLIAPYYKIIHHNTINPVIINLLGIFYLTLSGFYITKILNIKFEINKIIIYAIIYTYPLTNFFLGYGQDFDAYCLALLMSILSVYFLKKNDIKYHKLYSIITLVTSLALYQSYLVVTTGLYIFVTLILKEKKIIQILKEISIIILSGIIYYIILMLLLKINNIEMSSYRGADSFSIINTLKYIPNFIVDSYLEFFEIITKKSFLFDTDYNNIKINILIVFIFIYGIFQHIKTNKQKTLNLILLFLFIPSLYSINLLLGEFYDYIEFGFLIFLIGTIYLINNFKYQIFSYLIFSLLIFSNININNQLNMQTILSTEESLKISDKILHDLAAQENYSSESKVKIIGQLNKNENYKKTTTKPYDINIPFLRDTIPGYSIHTEDSIEELIQINGFQINIDSDYQYEEEKFKQAKEFPQNGYIYEENDVFIIKIGEK